MQLFHIVAPVDWAATGEDYRPESLAGEGFVHCSFAEQLAGTLARHYPGVTDLLILEIDPTGLDVRIEDTYGSGTSFPHVYGPIPRSAVRAVSPVAAASPDR